MVQVVSQSVRESWAAGQWSRVVNLQGVRVRKNENIEGIEKRGHVAAPFHVIKWNISSNIYKKMYIR